MKASSSFAVALILAALTGCATTTPESRELARQLESDVADYVKHQQDRIKALNAEYRSVYDILIAEYRSARDDRVKLSRQADARAAADRIAANWSKTTTLSALVGDLENARDKQFEQIERRKQAIAEVKSAYASSYTALKLSLKPLSAQRAQLLKLTKDENKGTLELLAVVAKAYADAADGAKGN